MTKKICITGASRGIGFAEAKLLENKNELFLHASSEDSFKKLDFKKHHTFGYDFSNVKNVDKFVSSLKQKTDNLDILVSNVGVMFIDAIQNYSDLDIHKMISINLHSHILLTKKILPLLLKSENPHIVFMSSMSAKNRIIGESVYAATKAGIMQFAHALRNELAGKVRVSTIHSWGVNTWNDTEGAEILTPKDIAETLEFIISRKRPFLIESIELGHENHWNGAKAPWSP